MNSKKLSEWLGITANLGVILGIVFLALEINQSTKATAAAVSDSVMTGYLELGIPINCGSSGSESDGPWIVPA